MLTAKGKNVLFESLSIVETTDHHFFNAATRQPELASLNTLIE